MHQNALKIRRIKVACSETAIYGVQVTNMQVTDSFNDSTEKTQTFYERYISGDTYSRALSRI